MSRVTMHAAACTCSCHEGVGCKFAVPPVALAQLALGQVPHDRGVCDARFATTRCTPRACPLHACHHSAHDSRARHRSPIKPRCPSAGIHCPAPQVYPHSVEVKGPSVTQKHKHWVKELDREQQAVRDQQVQAAQEEQEKQESVAKFSEVSWAKGCVR